MKVVILGAGQGKRLLPLTADAPKALLEIGGQSMLAWQVQELVKCGVREIVVVVGFRADRAEAALRDLGRRYPAVTLRGIDNPFYAVADNLASCWLARDEMDGDFVLINGDTLFEAAVLRRLLDSPQAPVTIAIDRKKHYDDDDMKVRLDGARLVEIAKTIPLDTVDGESIGMLLFRDGGGGLFAAGLARAMREGALKKWYLSVIDALARDGHVECRSIEGLDWCEVDYPLDLVRAGQMVAGWKGDADAESSAAIP